MASTYNQRAALNAFLAHTSASTGQNIPKYSKAREVIAISIPVRNGVLEHTDTRLHDIDQNTERGKVHAGMLAVFNTIIENMVYIAGVVDESSILCSVEPRQVIPGTLRVKDFIDHFGNVIIQADNGNNDDRSSDANQAQSAFDLFDQYMMSDAIRSIDDAYINGAQAEEDRPPLREPYDTANLLEGLSEDDPTVEVYIEMVYGVAGGEEGICDDAMDASARRAADHLRTNESLLGAYRQSLDRLRRAGNVPDEILEEAQARLDEEVEAIKSARGLLDARGIDSQDIPRGYGKRSDERLQCVTVWFVSATLISTWSVLKNIVHTTTMERDASANASTVYALRRDFIAQLERTTNVGPDSVEQENNAAISALLMGSDASGSNASRFEQAIAATGAAAAQNAAQKPRGKPQTKRSQVAIGADKSLGMAVQELNALANDYTVGDIDRSRKNRNYRRCANVMREDTNGDLDPAIIFSPLDAVHYHGDACHPLQSERMFIETDGATYFIGGLGRRCSDGFVYLHFPVPELVLALSPMHIREDYLRQCELPKVSSDAAPVMATCHECFTDAQIASIHLRGAVPAKAYMRAARNYINESDRRAAISSASSGSASFHQQRQRNGNQSSLLAKRRRAMKERIYTASGRSMHVDRAADEEDTPRDAAQSVLTFDPRQLQTNQILVQTDPDTQIIGSNVLKCVDAVVNMIARQENLTRRHRMLLVHMVRTWACRRIFEAASSKRNNSPAMRAIYQRAAHMSIDPPRISPPLTDNLPPISDFLARQCTKIATLYSSTEAHKVLMFWFCSLSALRSDNECTRRPNIHMMGPGGGGKGVIASVLSKLCNSYTSPSQEFFSTVQKLDGFSPKSFQDAENPFGFDHSIIVVEELPRSKIKNQDENGGAEAILKNLLTSVRTNVQYLLHDAATKTHHTVTVQNWVRMWFLFMSNGTDGDLEKAWRDRALGVYINDKEDTSNDINRAMTEDAHKNTEMERGFKRTELELEFKEMQAAVALIEDQLAFGGLTPIDCAVAMNILASIFSSLKERGYYRIDNRMLENISNMARTLCITEAYESEFKRPMGQFYNQAISAENIRGLEWSLSIKMHHVVAALGFYAPLMFPQGQEEFRLGLVSLLEQRISNICSNNRIDRLDDVAAREAEQAMSDPAGAVDNEDAQMTTDIMDDTSFDAIARVITAICQIRPMMREAARDARTRVDIERAYELDYVCMPETTFVSDVANAVRNLDHIESRPSITAITNLRWTLRTHTIKARPRKLGTSAFDPIVADSSRKATDYPIIKNSSRANFICVLRAFLDQNVSGMSALVRAMKEAFNNASTPPCEYLFSAGVGSSFQTIVLGRGLGPDSVSLSDVDLRTDPVTGEPIGPVSKAAHRPMITPNYFQNLIPTGDTNARILSESDLDNIEQRRLAQWENIVDHAGEEEEEDMHARDAYDMDSLPGLEDRDIEEDEEEEEEWSRISLAGSGSFDSNSARGHASSLRQSTSNSSSAHGEESQRDSAHGGFIERGYRKVKAKEGRDSAHFMLVLYSWDELSRRIRSNAIHMNAKRAPLYEMRIAEDTVRDYLVNDANSSLTSEQRTYIECLWGRLDRAVRRCVRADSNNASFVEDLEWLQNNSDDDDDDEDEAMLIDVFGEDDFRAMMASVCVKGSSRRNADEDEEDFESMADERSLSSNSGISIRDSDNAPATVLTTTTNCYTQTGAEPLPTALPSKHIAVVWPGDMLSDSRIDKICLLAKQNPCYIPTMPSKRIYNPRGEVPIWSLIPGCSGFEDYFLRIYSTPLDHRYRSLLSDPLYGSRPPYPQATVEAYRKRSQTNNISAMAETTYMVWGSKTRNSQRRKRNRSRVDEDSTPSTFSSMLQMAGIENIAKRRRLEANIPRIVS